MNPNYSVLILLLFILFIKMFLLPIELTNLILEFSGYHKLRNGIYMKQIAESQLFDMAIKIQRMPKIKHGYVKIKVAPTTTTSINKIETTMILFYSNSDYKSTRL
jgi:hypothetical protein